MGTMRVQGHEEGGVEEGTTKTQGCKDASVEGWCLKASCWPCMWPIWPRRTLGRKTTFLTHDPPGPAGAQRYFQEGDGLPTSPK